MGASNKTQKNRKRKNRFQIMTLGILGFLSKGRVDERLSCAANAAEERREDGDWLKFGPVKSRRVDNGIEGNMKCYRRKDVIKAQLSGTDRGNKDENTKGRGDDIVHRGGG